MSDRSGVSPADTGCSLGSPDPLHDPHSSEEELEVINSPREPRPLQTPSSSFCLPEKRKWSQVGSESFHSPCENEENMSQYGNISPRYMDVVSTPTKLLADSGSSDDEVHNLLASMATPVQFRTSPPLEALKPGGGRPFSKTHSLGLSSRAPYYEVSPRKRSRHARNSHVQRPCLDFEKMQQLKARSVTTWRHSGEHVGELSVFCW